MKKLLVCLFMGSIVHAQTGTTLFHENFELPSGADSVITSFFLTNPSVPATAHLWDDSSNSALGSGRFYHVYGEHHNTIYFETDTFSTIGAGPFVLLEFDHIAKLYSSNHGYIQISLDGGNIWQNLTANHYLGNSPTFISGSTFNEDSYLYLYDLWETGLNTQPDSSWWVNEKFNLTELVHNASGGFPHIMLRFSASFPVVAPQSVPPNNVFYAGWYVDNLKVTAYPCDPFAPDLSFHVSSNPCVLPPEGTQFPSSDNKYDVVTDVVDREGNLKDVLLIYSVNNGPEDTVVMIGSGINKLGEIYNAITGSSVQWYVIATDSCGNMSRLPADPAMFYHFDVEQLPGKCLPFCGSYNVINQFPWREDFESSKWIAGNNGTITNNSNAHRGVFPISNDWIIAPPPNPVNYNKFGWCIADSSTATHSTGPAGNHTPGGNKYLFTEGSLSSYVSGTNISATSIITPCIDLSQVTDELIFEYFYHLYGKDIDKLRIDIDTGQQNSVWWNAYKIFYGQTHSSSTDPWQREIIPLKAFNGKVIKIRIVGQKSGNDIYADIAIDDLAIYKADEKDVGLLFTDMVEPLPCALTSSENIKIIIRNFGSDSLTQIPVAYQLNSGSIVRDTAFLNLGLGDTGSFTFGTTADFSALGVYNLKAWTELPNDSVNNNDTLYQDNLYKSTTSASFPILLDFENATPASTLNSGNGLLSSLDFYLNITDNSANNGARWMIYDKTVKDVNSGPLGGTNREGKYLLLRDANGSAIPDVAKFQSNCLDFTGLSNPVISFKYHSYGGSFARIYIKENSSSNWLQIASTIPGISNSKDDAYRYKSVNLSSYAGKIVEIMFEGITNGNIDNLAIDDIQIFEKAAVDFALSNESTGFYQGINSSLPTNLSIEIANVGGSSAVNNLLLKGEFTNCANGNLSGSFQSAPVTFLPSPFTASLNNAIITYNNILPVGTYSLKMWIEVNGDTINNFNDTIWRNINIRQMESIPYFNDFETCNDELPKQGTFLEWARAMPSKGGNMNSAHNGAYVMMISPGEDAGQEEEILLLPTFTNVDTIYGEELRLWHVFNMGYGNGNGKVEYFKNQNWHTFPNHNSATNWTDTPFGSSTDDGFGISLNWIKSTYPLDVLGLTNMSIRFRSNIGYNGISWLIDDMEIYVPPQHSSSPLAMHFSTPPSVGNNQVEVILKNTGAAPLTETILSVYVNGNLQGTGNYNVSTIPSQGNSNVNLLFGINLTAGINNEIKIITNRPNNRMDAIPTDDTLIFNLFLPGDISSLPYCDDFETGSALLNYNPVHQIIDTVWQYGLPAKNILNTTHSGVNAWFTSVAKYPILADQYLYTGSISIEKDKCYSLSFWHQHRTELNFDGGNVEYTSDSGATWQVFGDIADTNWYNTPAIQSLDAYKPGWSGSSGAWGKVEKITKFYEDGKIQFRFRFASNSTINLEGWVIDDFCFEELAGACEYISMEEPVRQFSDIKLYPNPAHNKMWVISPVHIKEGAAFITDMKGKRIISIGQELIPNQPKELGIGNLPPGMYFLNYTSESNSGNVKFMVH